MILNSDSYFSIGNSHKINQDYCLHGKGNKYLTDFAIVADGCSGSPKTDFGSRIICQSVIGSIYYALHNPDFFQKDILNSATRSRDYLDLPYNSLDSTLFVLSMDEDDLDDNKNRKYRIFGYGDGSIIKIKNDNIIEFTYIEYPSGAPLYINYYANKARFDAYKNEYGVQRKIYRYTFIDNIVTDFKLEVDYNGECLFETGLCNDYKAILVTSDGISSFIGLNNNPVEITILVRALCEFKGYKGEFIQRRMNGFNNYCEKQGWKHTDDFSIAGIHISDA